MPCIIHNNLVKMLNEVDIDMNLLSFDESLFDNFKKTNTMYHIYFIVNVVFIVKYFQNGTEKKGPKCLPAATYPETQNPDSVFFLP